MSEIDKDLLQNIRRAYDRGYKTALDSVKFLIMGNSESEINVVSLLKMIEELEEEEEEDDEE